MPGPVSNSSNGPADDTPYVPSYLYRNGPKMCPCGHHEGYHGGDGRCLREAECGCAVIPPECVTSIDEM